MKIRISQLRQKLDDYRLTPRQLAARALRVKPGDILAAKLVRKSVDARDKGDVHFTLTLDVETAGPVRLPRNAAEIETPGFSAPSSSNDDSSLLNQWREASIPGMAVANTSRRCPSTVAAANAPKHTRHIPSGHRERTVPLTFAHSPGMPC